MRFKGRLLDLLVPPSARLDPRRLVRHRGIGKSLLSISGVVALLFLAYLFLRPHPTRPEILLFLSAILFPTLGALFIRATGRVGLGLFLTNLAGITIVACWCGLTGGITSVALPWFLPNLFLLSTFGSRRMLLEAASVLLGVLILLFIATQRNWLPASHVPKELTIPFTFLSTLSSAAVVVAAALVVTGEREKSKRLLFEATAAAEAANRAKSAFLASMSHELRTPLNAVLLSADLLKEDQDSPLNPRQEKIVDQLLQGGEILLGLVNQVLHLSSIEAGKVAITLEPVSLSEAAASSLGVIAPMARRRQVQLECDLTALADLQIMADALQLKSVLINLLSNAVKYNHPQGLVRLHASNGPDGRVRINISDTGKGIPEQMQGTLFQPFNRLGAEGTQIEGTGLGLSITERLVQMMSGRLGFDSIQGKGSTFWVELPAAPPSFIAEPPLALKAEDPASKPKPPAKDTNQALEVLVVEDHPVNQQLLCTTLERMGHRATVAPDGAEALRILEAGSGSARFDLILMDLLMPVMDGLEATRQIREKEEGTGRHIPIIAVTACALDRDREACFEAGMDDYLTKPISVQELAKLLEYVSANRAR